MALPTIVRTSEDLANHDPTTSKTQHNISVQELGNIVDNASPRAIEQSVPLAEEISQAVASVKAVLRPDIVVNELNANTPSELNFEVPDPTADIRVPPAQKPIFVPPQTLPEPDGSESRARASSPTVVDEIEVLPDHRPLAPEIGHYTSPVPVAVPETKETVVAQPVVDEKERLRGLRKLKLQKHAFQASILLFNGFLIFVSWHFRNLIWVLLPLITFSLVLQIVMIISIGCRTTWNYFRPEEYEEVARPESLALLIPCYNETPEEMTKSMDSLIEQSGIEQHPQFIVVLCDGKARGPGMAKTTHDWLLQDVPLEDAAAGFYEAAYTAWDHQRMDVILRIGKYRGVPCMMILKHQNQGKRDGLILIRSFLHKFNLRREQPDTIMSPEFFDTMCAFIQDQAHIDHVDDLVGMDADTYFDPECISNLVQESHLPKTTGVCGYVAVDFQDKQWGFWNLMQNSEYTTAQTLRRLHQSMVTHKVSCLPGCCQLLKITEETCGDDILVSKFGYYPTWKDGILKHIRATASEDRNHVCLLLAHRPNSQTRMVMNAKAYTAVPQSWSVYLSQRRRWTLGATMNDVFNVTAPGVVWFERLLAGVNVVTWFVNPFILAALGGFIHACIISPLWMSMMFVSIMMIPITWYLVVPLWHIKKWKASIQYYCGLLLFIGSGPFLAIFVLTYALINMDRFGWGKTRKVIAEIEPGQADGTAGEKAQQGMIEEAPHQRSEPVSSFISPAQSTPVQVPLPAARFPGRRRLDEEERVGW
ncbi:Hypothetical predicted protein [Lecanosticta acicola]|uniref:chitin synthase n=1 Tax=Lecanosticta acicola TaxID=111012 RepID=A0AAI9E7E9_9PEZI|nr:Hypothetical predicted protein [Lecanosticta acicola]